MPTYSLPLSTVLKRALNSKRKRYGDVLSALSREGHTSSIFKRSCQRQVAEVTEGEKGQEDTLADDSNNVEVAEWHPGTMTIYAVK